MTNRIHVVQVTYGMGIGGMERVIMDLCRYVDPKRFKFTIVCTSVRGALADQMEAEGVQVIFCKNQSRPAKYFRALELAKIFTRLKPDIIHTHHTTAFFHGSIGAKIARCPILINTDHCKDYKTVPRRWLLLERAVSKLADHVVAVSNHTRDELIQYEGIKPEKISVIYNGINIKRTRDQGVMEICNEFGISTEDIVIGTVARLEYQKGIDLLLETVPYVISQNPKVKFLIVGGGALEQTLRKQVHRLNISDNVIFTGWRSDAVDLIELFDCFVSTSNFEGMPMVLLEAMAQSKPIVAMSVGGIPEVVLDGDSGYLLHSRDPKELGLLLTNVIKNQGLRKSMGSKAKERYDAYFTAEVMANAYENLYKKYLNEKGAIYE